MFNVERAGTFGSETVSLVRHHPTVIVEGGGGFVQPVPFNIRGFGGLGALTETDKQALAQRLKDTSTSFTGGVTGSRDLLAAIPDAADRSDVAVKAIALGGDASTIQQAQRELESNEAFKNAFKVSKPVAIMWSIASTASFAACVYHGYKRNDSIGWAIGWGFMGALFPVITPVIAVAQGFAQPKRSGLGKYRRRLNRSTVGKRYRRRS
jgi:hypothetical protein